MELTFIVLALLLIIYVVRKLERAGADETMELLVKSVNNKARGMAHETQVDTGKTLLKIKSNLPDNFVVDVAGAEAELAGLSDALNGRFRKEQEAKKPKTETKSK